MSMFPRPRADARAVALSVSMLATLAGCLYREIPEPIPLGEGDVTGVCRGVPPGLSGEGVLSGVRVRLLGSAVTRSSGADGRFVLRNLPEGTHVLELSWDPDHDGRPALGRVVRVPIRIPTGQSKRTSLNMGDVLLLPGGTLTGTVAGTAPFDDVVVNLFMPGAADSFVLTDKRAFPDPTTGMFRFEGLGAGPWEVQAARGGLGSNRARVDVPGGQDVALAEPLLLNDPQVGTLQGTVLGEENPTGTSRSGTLTQGLSLPAFTVTLTRPDGTVVLTRDFADVRDFVIAQVPAGVYNVTIDAGDAFAPLTFVFVVLAGVPCDLGNVLVSRIGAALDDQDGDGLPFTDDPACIQTCLADVNASCNGKDCDDDADGQADLEEMGRGSFPACHCTATAYDPRTLTCERDSARADRDHDGICDVYDRYPDCAANRSPCELVDAGVPDAGAADAGTMDASVIVRDAGVPDASVVVMDAGPPDAGMDAGPPDAGAPDAATSPFGLMLGSFQSAEHVAGDAGVPSFPWYDGQVLPVADGYVALLSVEGVGMDFPASTCARVPGPAGQGIPVMVVAKLGLNGRCVWRTEFRGGDNAPVALVGAGAGNGRIYVAGFLPDGAIVGATTFTSFPGGTALVSLDAVNGGTPGIFPLGMGTSAYDAMSLRDSIWVDPVDGAVSVTTLVRTIPPVFGEIPGAAGALVEWVAPDLSTRIDAVALLSSQFVTAGNFEPNGDLVFLGANVEARRGMNVLATTAGGQGSMRLQPDGGALLDIVPLDVSVGFNGGGMMLQGFPVDADNRVLVGDAVGVTVGVDGGALMVDTRPRPLAFVVEMNRLMGPGAVLEVDAEATDSQPVTLFGTRLASGHVGVVGQGSRAVVMGRRAGGTFSGDLAVRAGDRVFAYVVRLDASLQVMQRLVVVGDGPSDTVDVMGVHGAPDGALIAAVRVRGNATIRTLDCNGMLSTGPAETLRSGMGLVRLPAPMTTTTCPWTLVDQPADQGGRAAPSALLQNQTPEDAGPVQVLVDVGTGRDEDCFAITADVPHALRVRVLAADGGPACPPDGVLMAYNDPRAGEEPFNPLRDAPTARCPRGEFRLEPDAQTARVCLSGYAGLNVGPAMLTAEVIDPPTNDACASPAPLVLPPDGSPTPVEVDMWAAGADQFVSCATGPDVFFEVTAPAAGGLIVEPQPDYFGSAVSAYMLKGAAACGLMYEASCSAGASSTGQPVAVDQTGSIVGLVGEQDTTLRLNMRWVPPPAHEACTQAQFVGIMDRDNRYIPVSDSTLIAGDFPPPATAAACGPYAAPDRGLYYRFTAGVDGRVTVNPGSVGNNTYYQVLTDDCGMATSLACGDLYSGSGSQQTFLVSQGTSYIIRVYTHDFTGNGAGTNFEFYMVFEDVPANDTCVGAEMLDASGMPGVVSFSGTTMVAGADLVDGTCTNALGPDVFYTFNPPMNGWAWLKMDSFVAVHVVSGCNSTSCAAGDAGTWTNFQQGNGIPLTANVPVTLAIKTDSEAWFSGELLLLPDSSVHASCGSGQTWDLPTPNLYGTTSTGPVYGHTLSGQDTLATSCEQGAMTNDAVFRITPDQGVYLSVNPASLRNTMAYPPFVSIAPAASCQAGPHECGGNAWTFLASGQPYDVVVGDGSGGGMVQLEGEFAPAATGASGDQCASATDLRATNGDIGYQAWAYPAAATSALAAGTACGSPVPGDAPELVYRVTLEPLERLWVNLGSLSGNPTVAIYMTPDCNAAACLGAAASYLQDETLDYTNNTGARQSFLLVLDSNLDAEGPALLRFSWQVFPPA